MKNSIVISILLISILTVSCDTGYFYQRSTLDIPEVKLTTDINGRFYYEANLSIYDFSNIDPFTDDLKNAQVINSTLTIDTERYFREGDRVELHMTMGNNQRRDFVFYFSNNGKAIIDDYDDDFKSYMYSMLNYIIKNSDTKVTFDGQLFNSSGVVARIPVYLSLINDVDIQIRK